MLLFTPREPSTENLEERVVVGPEEGRQALLDLNRQPLVVVHPMDGPADALVKRWKCFRNFLAHRSFRDIFNGDASLAPVLS